MWQLPVSEVQDKDCREFRCQRSQQSLLGGSVIRSISIVKLKEVSDQIHVKYSYLTQEDLSLFSRHQYYGNNLTNKSH